MKILVCLEPHAGRAAQAAARLGGQVVGAEVIWLTLGVQPCRLTGVQGIQKQIDVVDDRLAGAHPMMTAAAAAIVVQREAPELVLAGVRSDGRGLGLFPAAVAACLNWPFVAHVDATACNLTAARVWVEGNSCRAQMKLGFPAVLACTPKAPPGDLLAGHVPRQRLNLGDLGLDPKGAWRRSADWVTEPVRPPKPQMVHSAAAFWAAFHGKRHF